MEEERKEFIRDLLKQGKLHAEIRRELISQGFGTDGFVAVYPQLLSELGIEDDYQESKAADVSSVDFTPRAVGGGQMPLPSIENTFMAGVRAVQLHWGTIIVATVFLTLPTLLSLVVPTSATPYLNGIPFVVVSIGLILVHFVMMITGVAAVVFTVARTSDRISYGHGLQWALHRFGTLLWTGFLLLTISLCGFAALIIPGVAFMFYSMFTMIVLANDGHRGMDAIVRSLDLVMGYFWAILGRLLALLCVAVPLLLITVSIQVLLSRLTVGIPYGELIVAAPTTLLALLTAVFVLGGMVAIYENRVRSKTFFDASLYKGLRASFWLMSVCGTLIVVGAITLGAITVNVLLDEYREQLDAQFQFEGEFNQFPTVLDDGGEQVDRFIIERRVDTMYNAGLVHRSRMGSFEGVCDDVLIEQPARCQNTNETLVIDAPLGEGRYYCRDSSGYQGVMTAPAASPEACQ